MPNLSQVNKNQRAFISGRFVLEIDGTQAGLVVSMDGGHFKSEPIGEKVGAEGLETRYPGRQKWEDITIQVGTTMSPGFWNWVKRSVDNNYERRNGALVAYDFDGKERSRRSFYDALIAEVQFPALDAKAKTPAFITVKISAEHMEWKEGRGEGATPPAVNKQKLWVPSNFRFTIDGMPDMQWVQKVDQMTVKQNIIENPIGKEAYARKEIGRLEYPNFSFYVPETYAKPWMGWWQRFVADGSHEHGDEKHGSVEYLSQDLAKTLMTIEFLGLGITGVSFDKHDAHSDQIRMVKVDCYCESMTFRPGEGTS